MSQNEEKVRVQDDLFDHVNGEWMKDAVIPDDLPTVGGFADLAMGVEKLLMADFRAWDKGEKAIPDANIEKALVIYRKAFNVEERNALGVSPVLPVLSEIEKIVDAAYLNAHIKELYQDSISLPFGMGVTDDAKDTVHHCLALTSPSLILPDTTYYGENESGKRLIEVWKNMALKLLALIPGLDEQARNEKIEGCLAFDRELAKHVKSQLEWADYIKNYNPVSFDEICQEMAGIDFKGLVSSVYGRCPEKVIVMDPRYFEEFKDLWTESNFKNYVDWCYVHKLVSSAKYLSEECREIAHEFRRATTGVEKPSAPEKYAFRLVNNLFDQPIGIYYGNTYFGAAAKADVENIVRDLIEVYKERLAGKEWLSQATRERAILKLSTMVIKIGYPEVLSPVYDLINVDESKDLLANIHEINRVSRDYSDSLLDKDVDKSLWVMPAQMVNACYNPTSNDLTFPAAILQAPFYSLNQSRAENLGGIGAVIGHEISHAFDNNGAQCDEKGNINNWWTESDYAAFKEKTQSMIDEFEGLPLGEGKVSGALIVSENIADNGGVGAALGVAHKDGITDLKPFWLNWGKIWRIKAQPAYQQLLLKVDVHAPAYWRANMQPRNFEEWYESFDVKETDKMWLDPSKRVRIW